MPPSKAGARNKAAATRRRSAVNEELVRRCKALIYGPPKHGKTYFLGSAAFDERTAPMLLLDYEGGVDDVLEGMPGWGTDIVRAHIRAEKDFDDQYDRLRANDEGFKSCGIDSLSETHISLLMERLDTVGKTRKEPDLIEQGDYGIGLVKLRRQVRKFRDLPLHVFYTAHHKDEVDAREGLVKLPKLSGQAATEIPGMMSVVGYLALVTERDDEGLRTFRSLLLQNHAKVRVGVRGRWGVDVPDEIDDPTITALLDALKYEE